MHCGLLLAIRSMAMAVNLTPTNLNLRAARQQMIFGVTAECNAPKEVYPLEWMRNPTVVAVDLA